MIKYRVKGWGFVCKSLRHFLSSRRVSPFSRMAIFTRETLFWDEVGMRTLAFRLLYYHLGKR